MKTLVWMAAALIVWAMPAALSADAQYGQVIFKKKFRKKCGFSGARFARYHTRKEWEAIWKEGRFKEEAQYICPRLKIDTIKEEWWQDVYEFSYKHAKDGEVPTC